MHSHPAIPAPNAFASAWYAPRHTSFKTKILKRASSGWHSALRNQLSAARQNLNLQQHLETRGSGGSENGGSHVLPRWLHYSVYSVTSVFQKFCRGWKCLAAEC